MSAAADATISARENWPAPAAPGRGYTLSLWPASSNPSAMA